MLFSFEAKTSRLHRVCSLQDGVTKDESEAKTCNWNAVTRDKILANLGFIAS